MERDLRTLNQRRACHLTSTNAIKKRVEDAEALVIGAEKMAAEIDAAAKKKDESKKAKATVESNKRAKAKVEMQQRRANDLFQAELTLATTMSVTCTHVPDEDDDHAADNECAVCGLCDDCLQDHVTIMPTKWKWYQCGKCTVVWCDACYRHAGGIHEERHKRCAHTEKGQVGKKKQVEAREKKEERLLKAVTAKRTAAVTAANPDIAGALALDPAPGNAVITWISPRSEPFAINETAEDLLGDTDFREFSEKLLKLDEKEFLYLELKEIALIDLEVKDRLKRHIARVTRTMQNSYAWDYARNNISKMLAWKVMQGKVDYHGTAAHKLHQCFLLAPNRDGWDGEKIDATNKKTNLFGSYVVWDQAAECYVRSGKAVHIHNRVRKHDADKYILLSKFYLHWRHIWDRLEWYVSLGFEDAGQKTAAASAMFVSEAVCAKLKKAKWSGANKEYAAREEEMLAYLSELVDDLLMDSTKTTTSEAPGFEGPLDYYRKKK